MDAVRKCSAQDKQQIKCRRLVAWKKRRRQKYVKVSIMHDDVVGEPGEKLAKFVDFFYVPLPGARFDFSALSVLLSYICFKS